MIPTDEQENVWTARISELEQDLARQVAETDRLRTRVLSEEHMGMRVNYSGLFAQSRGALTIGKKEPALAEMLRQLQGHLSELGQRWYAGDTAAVDEFLQLYCIESDARDAIASPA